MDTYAYRYIDVVTCRDVKIFAENGIEFARELNSRANSGPKRCCSQAAKHMFAKNASVGDGDCTMCAALRVRDVHCQASCGAEFRTTLFAICFETCA